MPEEQEPFHGIKPDANMVDKTSTAGTTNTGQGGPPIITSPQGHQLTSFPVALVILLHFLTCGLFSLIWLNLWHGKLPRVRSDDPSAGRAVGFCFIPFFNLYWIFFTYRRLPAH